MRGSAQSGQGDREATPQAVPSKAPGAGARVIPYPAPKPFGSGKNRALALGGGGEWFEAWQLAYVTTLAKAGVDLATAEAVIGTSAGSLLGTMLTSGRIAQEANDFAWFAKHRAVMERMVSVNTGAAANRAGNCKCRPRATLLPPYRLWDARPWRRRTRRSRRCSNRSRPSSARSTGQVRQCTRPPSIATPGTGRGLADSGIPISHPVSASMSLPGDFRTDWIDDHYCMDGGISHSGTHADLVAGAKRVLVLALSDGSPQIRPVERLSRPDPRRARRRKEKRQRGVRHIRQSA